MKKTIIVMMVLLLIASSGAFADGFTFVGTLNASMYATGSTVSATIGPYWAAYTNEISLYTFNGTALTLLGYLGTNKANVGATRSYDVSQGNEIVVGIHVVNENTNYYSGAAGFLGTETGHAKVDFTGQNPDIGDIALGVLVGFEDLRLCRSDLDYNDATVVSLSGVGPIPPDNPTVPEPGTILAALSMLAPAGITFRRRK
jgi:hypothetical protein